MQKREKPKCTVLMKREKNKIQSQNKMVRLWWKKRHQKAAEEESQIMQLRWSVMNLYGVCSLMHCKKLYKGRLISVLQAREVKRSTVSDSLLLTLRAKCRAQTHQAQLNVHFTRLGPFLLWHDMKPRVAFLSGPRHKTWVRMTKNNDSSYGLFP